jgi:4-amino-4-deoxy-L-arabinose transferase-like glycosyltransferase
LLTLLALWLLLTLGLRPLLLPDEGRYGGVAREMLLGDAIVPTLNGLPYFHKPPLFYWIGMAGLKVFGQHEFAVRLAPALGAWLMGASLLLAMQRWFGQRRAAIALVVLASTPFFFIGGQYANHDMLVGGLITAAVLAMARAVDAPEQVDRRWLLVGWALCGLALLAKGLIGVVLPALVIGPWLLAQGHWRQMLHLLHPLGLLIFVAVAAPWLVAMQLRFDGFFDYFFIEQHFRRFAQSSFNNVQPFWFYAVIVPALTLPWVLWLLPAVRRLAARRDARVSLLAWWVVAVLGFFSLPSSKLVGYALPALAPWCAWLALSVADRGGRAWPWAAAVSAVLSVGIVVGVAVEAPNSSRALGATLAARMGAQDRVVLVDMYLFDLAFYADLKRPVVVASRWDDPEVARRDNWRKELFDAARFNPSLGRAVLRPLDRLDLLTCDTPAAWFVVAPAGASPVAALTGAARVFASPRAELWRAPGLVCTGER